MDTNTLSEDDHRQFGIGLDYSSSLFRIIDSAAQNDVRSIKLSDLSEPLTLPHDLNDTAPPLGHHPPSKELLAELDTPPQNISWADIPLLTDTHIHSSLIVPSIINISPSTNLNNSFQLWYKPFTNILLSQSLRSSPNPVAALTIRPESKHDWLKFT